MKDQFEEYIALLETLKEELDRLAALARKKNEAVCGDDLLALVLTFAILLPVTLRPLCAA